MSLSGPIISPLLPQSSLPITPAAQCHVSFKAMAQYSVRRGGGGGGVGEGGLKMPL